jgi:hypothetical protein
MSSLSTDVTQAIHSSPFGNAEIPKLNRIGLHKDDVYADEKRNFSEYEDAVLQTFQCLLSLRGYTKSIFITTPRSPTYNLARTWQESWI